MLRWIYTATNDVLYRLDEFSSFSVMRVPLNGEPERFEVQGYRPRLGDHVTILIADTYNGAAKALDQMALTLDAIDAETL